MAKMPKEARHTHSQLSLTYACAALLSVFEVCVWRGSCTCVYNNIHRVQMSVSSTAHRPEYDPKVTSAQASASAGGSALSALPCARLTATACFI